MAHRRLGGVDAAIMGLLEQRQAAEVRMGVEERGLDDELKVLRSWIDGDKAEPG